VLDGPIDGESFRAYIEEFLAPAVMDNLASHKVAGICEAIEAVGASVRYLPRYSPDLNPIEQLFAKLKARLRKAATRTIDTLWAAVAEKHRVYNLIWSRMFIGNDRYAGEETGDRGNSDSDNQVLHHLDPLRAIPKLRHYPILADEELGPKAFREVTRCGVVIAERHGEASMPRHLHNIRRGEAFLGKSR
jgi:transposase